MASSESVFGKLFISKSRLLSGKQVFFNEHGGTFVLYEDEKYFLTVIKRTGVETYFKC